MTTTRIEQQQVTTTPLFEDQIRGYRRNQRRLYNAQQAVRRVGQALTGGTSTRHTLEQQIEPEAQLQLSMQERASIVPAEPAEVNIQTMMDGRISLSFSNYAVAQPAKEPKYNNNDEEILAVLIETHPGIFTHYEGIEEEYFKNYGDYDEYMLKGKQIAEQEEERYSSEPHILVNRMFPQAVLPKRQTEGSTGLDIAASHAAII
ncbi:hypothetical protein ZIOFF_062682 [Zingiber officinale]|uniref:Uncharacterized protein n=1 Tax=Zingiber officinale TaxID=94328 RepID=A0A8J5F2B1_ZINOF|nr:hypothetical protein ZIOFF_062682 [Zingiber officinale]